MPRATVQDFPASLSFDGVNQKISLGTSNALTSITDFSFEVWIRPIIGLTNNCLFSSGFSFGGNTGILVKESSTAGNEVIQLFQGSTSVNFIRPKDPGWSHICVTQSGSSVSAYFNGTSIGTTTLTQRPKSGTPSAYIGSETVSTNFYKGYMSKITIYNRALSASEVMSRYQGSGLLSGTIAYYQLGEGSGTTANDTSGNGLNGTIVNGTWSADVPSKTRTLATTRAVVQDFKASLALSGASQYVNIPHIAALATNTFSVSFWYKRISVGTSFSRLLDKKQASTTTGWSIQQNASTSALTPYIDLRNSAGTGFSAFGNVLPNGVWRHYIFSFDGTNITVSESGVQVSSTPFSGTYTPSTLPAVLNSSATTGGGSFGNMQIAGLKFHNHALTTAEQLAVYNGASLPTDAGTYISGEGTGTTLYDTSANLNHGTITAGTYTSDVPSRKRQTVGDSLVRNGDFSFIPPFTAAQTANNWIDGTATGTATQTLFGWYAAFTASSSTAQFDSTTTYNGLSSLKLSTLNTTGRVRVTSVPFANYATLTAADRVRVVPVSASTSYTISMYIKTNNTVAAKFQVEQLNISLGDLGGTGSATVAGTNDWQKVTVTLTTSASTAYLGLFMFNDTAGNISDAWFTNVSLTPTVSTTRSLAT